MADNIAADPTPPPPTPTPTSATVIHILLQVLAATLSSLIAAGVFPVDSTGLQIATIIAANLAALGYGQKTVQTTARLAVRAALKRSQLIVLGLGLGALLGLGVNACAGAPKPIATFGACSVSSLEADVGNGTLLNAVEQALLADNYAEAIAGLITKVGEQEVSCAVLAIDDVLGVSSSSSSATPRAGTAEQALLRQRAADVIAKRGWRPAAKAAK